MSESPYNKKCKKFDHDRLYRPYCKAEVDIANGCPEHCKSAEGDI